jgi:Tol biopolymer transport system component/pimeloyl-ACP methyl ester carboxylesterase
MKRLVGLVAIGFVACMAVVGGPAPAPSRPVGGASAADGGLIAFVSDRDGNDEIYVMNADGTGQTNLTNYPKDDLWPRWSPNGEKIAFSRVTSTCVACTPSNNIFVMNADGSQQTTITDVPMVSAPAWSPDGTKIAFASGTLAEPWPIFVVNADGTRLTQMAGPLTDGLPVKWSPDGKRIAFTYEGDVHVVDADGTNDRTIASGSHPSWSPDGSKIAFEKLSDIYVIGADGTGETNLTNDQAGSSRLSWSPWSPDAAMIAFVSDRDGNNEVYVMNADGTNQTNLTNDPADDGGPSWSPDGSLIAFVSERDGNDEVYVMNADGTDQTNLTNSPANDGAPAWQPVGAATQLPRAVVFIQGIDSESRADGDCSNPTKGFLQGDGANRVQWMVDKLPPLLQQAGLDVQPDRDFYYVSYSGVYCDADGHQKPVYKLEDTCYGVDDHSSDYAKTGAAGKLDAVMQDVLQRYQKVDIIAHSMGGMAAAYWVQTHSDLRARVNSVVTFDSPLRGVPDLNQSPKSKCDHTTSPSQIDLVCNDPNKPADCKSTVVAAIGGAASDVPFFTIDATQNTDFLGMEAVPGDRTTLLQSDSKLHCKFDDNHSSVWQNGGTGGMEPIECWTDMHWPPDPDNRPKLRIPDSDAKAAFVACAIAALPPLDCIEKIGKPLEPTASLSAAALSGATALPVNSNAGLAVGDRILINPGMPNEEENQVVGFGSILLASPLHFDHQADEPLVTLSAPPSMAAGWNQACYLGAEQPIDQALADIAGDVLAVYRLNSSQTFDRWFPGRPDVSTITTVAPYQPLFVLIANDAAWSQAPTETPPTSASLVPGWNSLCYAGQTKPADDATAGMAGNFSILYRLGSDQTWGRFVPGRPEVSSISDLNTYDPVLILVTAAGGTQWVFDP